MSVEWTALPAGFIIATLATLVGFGGGILWMPFLILVARLDPTQAVVTSLVIQVGGMGSGSLAVIKAKKADLRPSLTLSACAFLGVPIGVWLSRVVSADSLVFLLGVLSLTMALVFVYTQDDFENSVVSQVSLRQTAPYLWLSTLFAILTGLLSMGVGDFLVPILRNRLRMTMESAMSACLIVMAMNAALAAILHLMIGETFATNLVLWAIPGVLLGGQIGPRLAGRIPDQTLKEIFIYGLSLAGIHMMFNMPGSH
ncbi:MAG: sulfite exporter TauE/SafE family protein [Desulfomonile tiedjei]|uniref:Probable membrane transporter protein n=1 Tax=Desulfomonile tiedjei TaxID=2358 RepID=A0A9D6V4E5_9BACT|nr:sulfite exporter TauE/SafE family protein [Desulfomonile tiedjei]